MKKKLDSVSSSFCLNMWHFGHVNFEESKSTFCCHIPRRDIPASELSNDPKALLNTQYSMERKQEMLAGIRHKDCASCWKAEESGGISNRIVDSHYLRDRFDSTLNNPLGQKEPAILELFFSSKCNFKCIYCDSRFSSKWKSEIEEFGPYRLDSGFLIHSDTHHPGGSSQPALSSFWNWWPELKSNLKQLKITGGEPLLHPETRQIIQYLTEHPVPDLEFSVNTNLGIPEKLVTRFCEEVSGLQDKIGKVSLCISMEAVHDRAEYIRHGLNWDLFERNLNQILSLNTIEEIIFNSSITCLSLPYYSDFLQFVSEVRKAYPKKDIAVEPNLVFDPGFLHIENTPLHLRGRWKECEKIFESFGDRGNVRLLKIQDIGKQLKKPLKDSFAVQENRLRAYLKELDRRRGISHQKIFPEYFHPPFFPSEQEIPKSPSLS